MAIKNVLLGGVDNVNGDIIDADDVNDTNDALVYNDAPVGSVIAWLKSLTNTPSLPAKWVECNGQTLSDGSSPYNGVTLPDLNGSIDTGLKGRFLRGHSTSGEVESSQNLSHSHTYTSRSGSGSSGHNGNGGAGYPASTVSGDPISSSGGTEARPHNYSVVWIIKIKR